MLIDLHVGISRWREIYITKQRQQQQRVRGVWDPVLVRETIVLKDNRRLTYFLDGPILHRKRLPHIFVFHAMFLSGNCFIMSNPPTEYVLVCINRPGYFGSDLSRDGDYNYTMFASDMEQLADQLQIDTFYVAGHSSGGPCALSCAANISNRVQAVGILCGDPEYAHDGVPNKRFINVICLGYFLPFLLKYVLRWCLPVARGTYQGLMNDYKLETSIYPYRTETIYHPTIVFVGENDKVMPLEISRHVHERLDNSQLKIIPIVGHMGLLRDHVLEEFFTTLLSLASSSCDVESSGLTAKTKPVLKEQVSGPLTDTSSETMEDTLLLLDEAKTNPQNNHNHHHPLADIIKRRPSSGNERDSTDNGGGGLRIITTSSENHVKYP